MIDYSKMVAYKNYFMYMKRNCSSWTVTVMEKGISHTELKRSIRTLSKRIIIIVQSFLEIINLTTGLSDNAESLKNCSTCARSAAVDKMGLSK